MKTKTIENILKKANVEYVKESTNKIKATLVLENEKVEFETFGNTGEDKILFYNITFSNGFEQVLDTLSWLKRATL